MTSSAEIISAMRMLRVKYQNLLIKNAEVTMSLLHRTDVLQSPKGKADRKHPEYSLMLALLCAALALVVASAIFTPAIIGSGTRSEISLVGP